MHPLARKVIASTLAAALVFDAAPWPAFADVLGRDEGVRRLQLAGILTDRNQSWLVDRDGRLTRLGEIIDARQIRMQVMGADLAQHDAREMRRQLDRMGACDRACQQGQAQGDLQNAGEIGRMLYGEAGAESVGDEERAALAARQAAALNGGQSAGGSGLTLRGAGGGVVVLRDGEVTLRVDQNQRRTFDRQVAEMQREMNRNPLRRPLFVPETGHYNEPMLEYWRLQLQERREALDSASRRNRLMLIAQLLGLQNQMRGDMLLDPAVERDLEARAQERSFGGRTVLQIADEYYRQMGVYLRGAADAEEAYEAAVRRLVAGMDRRNPVITLNQIQELDRHRTQTRRYLTLATLEVMAVGLRAQIDGVDHGSADSHQLFRATENDGSTAEERAAYQVRLEETEERSRALLGQLESLRAELSGADYAANMDAFNAALQGFQEETQLAQGDFAIVSQLPALLMQAREQTESLPVLGALTRGIRGMWAGANAEYAEDMGVIREAQGFLAEARSAVIAGDMHAARVAISRIDPDSRGNGAVLPNATDDSPGARAMAGLQVVSDRVGRVFEANKWIDTVGAVVTWAGAAAVFGGMARYLSEVAFIGLKAFTGSGGRGGMAHFANEVIPSMPFARRWASRAWRAPTRAFAVLLREITGLTATNLGRLEAAEGWSSGIMKAVTRRMPPVAASVVEGIGGYVLGAGVRFLKAANMHVFFMGIAGGASGVMVGITNEWSRNRLPYFSLETWRWERGHPERAMFASFGDAFMMGLKGGAWWSQSYAYPIILYTAFLPATALRGTGIGGIAENIAQRGLVDLAFLTVKGGTRVTLNNVVGGALRLFNPRLSASLRGWVQRQSWGRPLERAAEAARASGRNLRGGMHWLSAQGPAGMLFSTVFGMADNMAKFMAFSWALGLAGRAYGYHAPSGMGGSADAEDEIARIKGAHHAHDAWYESWLWMLLPMPGMTRGQMESMMAAQHSRLQHQRAGLLGRLLSTEEHVAAPLLGKVRQMPWLLRAILGGGRDVNQFEGPVDAARPETLRQHITAKFADAEGRVSLEPLLEIARRDDGQDWHGMKVDDALRSVTDAMILEQTLRQADQARDALRLEDGHNPVFGERNVFTREDLAFRILTASQEGYRVPADLLATARKTVEHFEASVRPVVEHLDAVREAAVQVPARDARVLREFAKRMDERMETWEKDPNREHYTEFSRPIIEEVRGLARDGKLSETGLRYLELVFKTPDIVRARFHTFNRVDVMHPRVQSLARSLKNRVQGAGSKSLADAMIKSLDHWRTGLSGEVEGASAVKGELLGLDGKPVRDASGQPVKVTFEGLLDAYNGWIRDAADPALAARAGRRVLSAEEKAVLERGVEEMGQAAWLIRDIQGTPMKDLNPQQFIGSIEGLLAYGDQAREGAGGPRLFQQKATSAGKTLFIFTVLLPLLQAVGRRTGREVVIVTTDALKAQMIAAGRAYKIQGRVISYGELLHEQIQATQEGRDLMTEKIFIMDEMDAAALMAQLSLGQDAGSMHRLATHSRLIRRLETSNQLDVNRLHIIRSEKAFTLVESARTHADRLEQPGEGAARNAGPLRGGGERLQEAAAAFKNAPDVASRARARRDLLMRRDELLDALDAAPAADPSAAAALRADLRAIDTALEYAPRRRSLGTWWENLFSEVGADVEMSRTEVARSVEKRFEQQAAELNRLTREETPRDVLAAADRLARELEADTAALEREIASLEGAGRRPDEALIAELSGQVEANHALLRDLGTIRSGEAQPVMELLGLNERIERGRPLSHEELQSFEATLQPSVAQAKRQRDALSAEQFQALTGRRDALLARLDSSAPGNARLAREHAAALERLEAWRHEKTELTEALPQARRGGRDAEAEAHQRRLEELEGLETREAEAVSRLEGEMAATGTSAPGLAGLVARQIAAAREGRPPSERRALTREGQNIVRRWMEGQSSAIVKELEAGNHTLASTRLRGRREMLERLSEEEGALYREYREMLGDGWQEIVNRDLWSQDSGVARAYRLDYARRMEGPPLGKVLFPVIGLYVRAMLGMDIPITRASIERFGLVRLRSARMLRALLRTEMPVHQRDALGWELLSSLLWPKGMGNGSWVYRELVTIREGYKEDPGHLRYDAKNRRIMAVHNATWHASMDNPTRRFHSARYGADELPLPYDSIGQTGYRNVVTNRKAMFWGLSGTIPEQLARIHSEFGVALVGRGSRNLDVEDLTSGLLSLRLLARESARDQIMARLESLLASETDRVVLRKYDLDSIDPSLLPALEAFIRDTGFAVRFKNENALAISLSELAAWSGRSGADAAAVVRLAARLRELREWTGQENTALLQIVLPDTKAVVEMYDRVRRELGLSAEEIVVNVSDVAYLRRNRPDIRIDERANLEALTTTRARVQFMDAQKAGRGYDPNYRGQRNSRAQTAARGYGRIEVLHFDANRTAVVDETQAVGRTAEGRRLAGAQVSHTLLVDVHAARLEPIFQQMIRTHEFFTTTLPADPGFAAYAAAHGRADDLAVIAAYVERRGADGTPEGAALLEGFNRAVLPLLRRQQDEVVQTGHMNSSGVTSTAIQEVFPGFEAPWAASNTPWAVLGTP